MNAEEILTEIEIALKAPQGSITKDSSSENVENWDSLGQLGILVALDKLFAGKIAQIQEMALADSVEKILNLLKKNSLI